MTVVMGLPSSASANSAIGASRGADLATCDAPSPQRIHIRLGSEHHKLRRHHPRSAPIAALGIYSDANLAKLAEPSFDVLIYAFGRLRCALRRYHSL